MNRYGFSAALRLVKAFKSCVADDFRSVQREAAGERWRCS